jgi:hypothetical protein
MPFVSVNERRELLARALAAEKRRGWRVEWQSDYQAVMVKRRWLDRLLLAGDPILLFGGSRTFTRGDQRQLVEIDEFGETMVEAQTAAPI